MNAPEFLTEAAADKWYELAPMLSRNGLLTEADLDALSVYCQTWARWIEAEEQLETGGATTVAQSGDQGIGSSGWILAASEKKSYVNYTVARSSTRIM
jgi:P27 family predicted phage terminase small subunit